MIYTSAEKITMSNNPFTSMFGSDPISTIVQKQASEQLVRTQLTIDAYRNNIAMPDVAIVDHRKPAVVSAVLGEDGKPIDMARRQELAANRTKTKDIKDPSVIDYEKEEVAIETQQYGKAAEDLRLPVRMVTPEVWITPTEEPPTITVIENFDQFLQEQDYKPKGT